MSVDITSGVAKLSIIFNSSDPIKWEDLLSIFKEHEIKIFGQGFAIVDGGEQVEAFIGKGDFLEWVYIPQKKTLLLTSNDIEKSFMHFININKQIKDLFKSEEKWSRNFSYYEVDIRNELVPSQMSPLEIFKKIANEKMFEPFQSILTPKEIQMFMYRFISTSNTDVNLKKVIPFIDVSLWPMVENTDRLMAQIIYRDYDIEKIRETILKLSEAILTFIKSKEELA